MVKYDDFAFPPRTVSRAKSKLSTSVPTSADIRMKEENAPSEDRAEGIVLYSVSSCCYLIRGDKLPLPSWRALLFCHP
jgi:hypothetical protein